MKHRTVRRFSRINTKLLEQAAKADFGALVANADPDRTVFVMNANRDHRALKPRITDARHCQEQLARKESWRFHSAKMRPA